MSQSSSLGDCCAIPSQCLVRKAETEKEHSPKTPVLSPGDHKASTQGGLPNDSVLALAFGADGSLWAGTDGGLARLDEDGHWQTYSKASTRGGLPNDSVRALAFGADGSLWAGTDRGGVGNFNRPIGRTLRIVEVMGKVGEVAQADQTIAVTAFDESYLTQPGMFHYIWRLSEIGLFSITPGREIQTRSSVYRAVFPHDGVYQLRVVAVDRYGNRSDPKDINFKVALPRPNSAWDTLVAAWPIVVATVTGLLALEICRRSRVLKCERVIFYIGS